MPHRVLATFLEIGLLLAAIAPAVTSAQDDPVLAGYQRFYRGDKDGARAHFEKLVAANPETLPARFALLQGLEDASRTDRSLQAQFERQMDAFIADAEARYSRSDKDDEALFYLGNAHMVRAAYRFNNDKGMWGAARDGAKSKRYADAYVKRHPGHADAYFTLGTYNYYVELAPSFIKVIRPLLFLPSGNRAEGLQQLERAYTQGRLFSFPAGMVLMEIYGSFEGRPADGVRVGEQLARAYPDNPSVQFALAELYLGPAVEDSAKAAAQYEKVIASEAKRAEPRPTLFQAQLGLASSLFQQWRGGEAVRVLSATIDARPSAPAWVMPTFLLRRANYRALLGDGGADGDVQRVLAEPTWKDRHKNANDLVKWMAQRRASGDAAVYAALIPGNRLMTEKRWDEAAAAYETVRRDRPNDPQLRFRLAVLRFERGDADGASVIAGALAADRTVPAWIRAGSLLMVARAHDLAGRREQAKRTYKTLVDDFEREGAVWPARVGLVTPYRRP
jgi:tetratricopeptide (TPR) repeat protein